MDSRGTLKGGIAFALTWLALWMSMKTSSNINGAQGATLAGVPYRVGASADMITSWDGG